MNSASVDVDQTSLIRQLQVTKSVEGASKIFLWLAWCLISKSSAPGLDILCGSDNVLLVQVINDEQHMSEIFMYISFEWELSTTGSFILKFHKHTNHLCYNISNQRLTKYDELSYPTYVADNDAFCWWNRHESHCAS